MLKASMRIAANTSRARCVDIWTRYLANAIVVACCGSTNSSRANRRPGPVHGQPYEPGQALIGAALSTSCPVVSVSWPSVGTASGS